MTTTLKTTVRTAIAIVGIAVLTACGGVDPTPEPTQTATTNPVTPESPAPVETEEPAQPEPAVLEVGAPITDDDIVARCQPFGIGLIAYGDGPDKCPLDKGQRPFTLDDGTTVLIDVAQPLPEAVEAAITAQAKAGVTTAASADHGAYLARDGEIKAGIAEAAKATGKKVVAVVTTVGTVGCGPGANTTVYVALGATGYVKTGECPSFATAAEAKADAEAAIGTMSKPEEFVVIVLG